MIRRDPNEIPVVARWNAEMGGQSSVLAFLGEKSDPETALVVGHLLWPAVTEVRGCVLRSALYSPDVFDAWWTTCEGDVARIESVMNHVHLWDVFPYYEDSDGVLTELADLLVETWAARLETEFPGRAFLVRREDDYGPGLTFHS